MIRFGLTHHRFDSTESTQDLAMAAARGGTLPGTVFSARCQTKGRGRRGRTWTAPSGANVNVSVVGPAVPSSRLWELAPLAGIAVVEAITGLLPMAPVHLRFPNDVILDGRKVAGILIEATPMGHDSVPVIGMGVNVLRREMPSELAASTIALEELATEAFAQEMVDRVLDELLDKLGEVWGMWEMDGFHGVAAHWNKWRDPECQREFRIDGRTVVATVGELGPDGRVDLRFAQGGWLRIPVESVVLGDA